MSKNSNGWHYTYRKRLIHRDLKPENILNGAKLLNGYMPISHHVLAFFWSLSPVTEWHCSGGGCLSEYLV